MLDNFTSVKNAVFGMVIKNSLRSVRRGVASIKAAIWTLLNSQSSSKAMQKLEAATISSLPVFQGLPLEAIQAFGRSCIDRAFGKGEMIYFPRGEGGRVFLLLSGEVRLYRSAEGRKVVLQVLKPGGFFGDLSFAHDPYPLEAENYTQAVADSKVCVISTDDLKRLLDKHSGFGMVLLTAMRDRLHQAESKIKDLALLPAETRIINELIRHSVRHGKLAGDFYEIEERLTHQALSEMVGVTRETVTKTLQLLEKSGFIQYTPGKFILLNKNKVMNECAVCLRLASEH